MYENPLICRVLNAFIEKSHESAREITLAPSINHRSPFYSILKLYPKMKQIISDIIIKF